MKKCLIIVNSYNKLPSYLFEAQRMQEEFKKKDVEARIIKTDELHILISKNIEIAPLEADFVVSFDKDVLILKSLEKLGYKTFNPALAIENCDNKFLTHLVLSDSGIKMPKTIPGLLCYSGDKKVSDEYFDFIQKSLQYPLIFKECYGSLGKNVYMIKDENELKSYIERFNSGSYLVQEFIKSSEGKDCRMIVIGHKYVASMIRENTHDFRSNIGVGGVGRKFNPPQEFIDVAIKASELLDLDYCGIDILFGENNEPILCEVNSNAFFKEFERITAINVAKIYVEYILNKVY
jgi:gamma-F420-2:alpha-L-glutamate ligase